MDCNRSATATFAVAVLLLSSFGARAEWLLQPGSERVQAGHLLEVIVYVVNDTSGPIPEDLGDDVLAPWQGHDADVGGGLLHGGVLLGLVGQMVCS